MIEQDSTVLVPLTFSEIRTLRKLLLTTPNEIGNISQEEKQRIVLKFHVALEEETPLKIATHLVQ
jgi:hypothetical protein